MKTVTTIHLNGRAYQVEEEAHGALATYLEKAAAVLADNPDKDEILADFEQAIAEKCNRYLTPNKNVISETEIKTIITEMGPVEGTAELRKNTEKKSDKETATSPKRLYRIKEGAIIAGVCNGLAAYFNVDVVLVRVAFVIITLISHGAGIFAYFIMMMIVPRADTTEERAQAQGMPFTAHDLLAQAKKNYAEYRGGKNGWKSQMREQKKYWKYKAKAAMRESKQWKYERNTWAEAITGMIWFAFLIALCVFAYRHIPFFHYNFDRLGHWITMKLAAAGK